MAGRCGKMRAERWGVSGALALLPLCLLLVACDTGPVPPTPVATTSTTHSSKVPQPTATFNPYVQQIGYTPQQFRDIYGVTPLIDAGITGKGVTVAVIESYGSPTIQQDVDAFDQKYGLPALHVQVDSPLGTVPFDPTDSEMQSWREETTLDVEIIHTIAPDAQVVVMTSPVDETEGVQGLPQFRQLEQDVVNQHLATIISQSFGVSEYTLEDSAGRREVQAWDTFFHQATTQEGITFIAGSGDNGATDRASKDLTDNTLVPSRTVGFPASDPWVIAVGGTRVWPNSDGSYNETVWGGNPIGPDNGSEGGFSALFAQPSYQQGLPQSIRSEASGKRGIPDVAGAADPVTGLECYGSGWFVAGGTSASGPLWAGIAALAEQEAGHPLGFLNPALYKLGAGAAASQDFHDVTVGSNTDYTPDRQVFVQGYSAGPGWDPVTGWGAPLAGHLVPDLLNALK